MFPGSTMYRTVTQLLLSSEIGRFEVGLQSPDSVPATWFWSLVSVEFHSVLISITFPVLKIDLSPSSEGVERSYGTWESPETSIRYATITFRLAGEISFEGKQKFLFFSSIYPYWMVYGTNFRNPLYSSWVGNANLCQPTRSGDSPLV